MRCSSCTLPSLRTATRKSCTRSCRLNNEEEGLAGARGPAAGGRRCCGSLAVSAVLVLGSDRSGFLTGSGSEPGPCQPRQPAASQAQAGALNSARSCTSAACASCACVWASVCVCVCVSEMDRARAQRERAQTARRNQGGSIESMHRPSVERCWSLSPRQASRPAATSAASASASAPLAPPSPPPPLPPLSPSAALLPRPHIVEMTIPSKRPTAKQHRS